MFDNGLTMLVLVMYMLCLVCPPGDQATVPSKKSKAPSHTAVTVSAGLSKEELAKEKEIEETLKQGDEALARKDFHAALKVFLFVAERAQELQERKGAIRTNALRKAARCYTELNQDAEAEKTYEHLGVALLEWGGPLESSIGHNYLDLAALRMRREDWAGAEAFAQKAIKSYDLSIEHFAPTDEPSFIATNVRRSKTTGLYYLAVIQARQRKHALALATLEQAYVLGEKYGARWDILMKIVQGAQDLAGLTGRAEDGAKWRKRERELLDNPRKPPK